MSRTFLIRLFLAFGALILACPGSAQIASAGLSGIKVPTFQDYRRAAEKGHPMAQLTIGYMYLEGREVDADPTEAEKWFLKAASQGDPAAQMELGILYYQGRKNFPMDFSKAYAWVKMASERFQPNEQKSWAFEVLNRMEYSLSTVQKGLAYDLFVKLSKTIPKRPTSPSILKDLEK